MTLTDRLPAARLRRYRQLAQKKFRRSARLCLVEGLRLVREALGSDWTIEAVLVSEALLGKGTADDLLRLASSRGAAVYRMTEREMDELSDTVTAQGILAVASWREYSLHDILNPEGPMLVVALDGVGDPGNVGTIVRICDWFRADGLLLDSSSVEVHNPKVLRGSMGGVFRVPVIGGVDLPAVLGEMKAAGATVFSTVPEGGESVESVEPPARSVIVLGSEAHGVSPEVVALVDRTVSIPRYGGAESLNVAVACGIVLAAIRAKLP